MKISSSTNTFTVITLLGLLAGCCFATETTTTANDIQVPSKFMKGLDTGRDPSLFQVAAARKGGYTYQDTVILHTETKTEVMGQSFTTTLNFNTVSETVVSDLSGGGQEIQVTTLSTKSSMGGAFGVSIECDSENPTMNSDPDMCKPLLEGVGTTETMTMDEQGNIVKADGPSGTMVEAMAKEIQQSNRDYEQFQQTSRLLSFIPTEYPVKPGDTWDEHEDLGEMGMFSGKSTLLGYKTFKEVDVAVIYVDGNLHMQMNNLMEAMGADATVLSPSDADASTTQIIYWDYQEELALWSQVNITVDLDMKSPITGKQTHAPVFETVELFTEIKDRGDSTTVTSGNENKIGDNKLEEPPEVAGPSAVLEHPVSQTEKVNPSGVAIPIVIAILLVVGIALAVVVLTKVGRRSPTHDEQQEFV